ncbi:DUF6483 family protein [Ruminococcaceae bacterium OttesenSCG-928-I18]|nr:DUF6483 family protein [Ruminococcaceae bacterium OttesenSCG-928-I18]
MSNDWLMRQIEDMTRLVASIVFHKKFEPYAILEEDGQVNEENLLYGRLRARVRQGDIPGAEVLLIETLEKDPREEYLPVALAFYEGLAQMDDARLHSCRYSREEILKGLVALEERYGQKPDTKELP